MQLRASSYDESVYLGLCVAYREVLIQVLEVFKKITLFLFLNIISSQSLLWKMAHLLAGPDNINFALTEGVCLVHLYGSVP